jgi:hypothetical protein
MSTPGRGQGGRFAPGNSGRPAGAVSPDKQRLAELARSLHDQHAEPHYRELFKPTTYVKKPCPARCQGGVHIPEAKALPGGEDFVLTPEELEPRICETCRGTGRELKPPTTELMKVRETALENLRNRGWGKPPAVVKLGIDEDDGSPEALMRAIMSARTEPARAEGQDPEDAEPADDEDDNE